MRYALRVQLKQPQLAAHLKQGLAPLYVVAGEEPLLIQESLDAIRAAARKTGYSEREVLEVAPGFAWSRLTEAGGNLSLFASQRIIELHLPRGLGGGRAKKEQDEDAESAEGDENSGGGGSAQEGSKLLQQWAEKPPADTLLIVVAGKLDSRARSGGWFAALEKAGASLYFWPVKPDELPAWIAARMKSSGLDATPDAIQELADRTEGHLLACAQDIAKLKLLFGDSKSAIGLEQVQAAVADSAHFEAFDLVNKMLSGDATGAARSLARIRESKLSLPELMGAIAYSLRQWAHLAMSYAKSKNVEAALAEQKIFGPRGKPYESALRRAPAAQVLGWLARCTRIDRLSKSTRGKEAAWEELLNLLLVASGAPMKLSPSPSISH